MEELLTQGSGAENTSKSLSCSDYLMNNGKLTVHLYYYVDADGNRTKHLGEQILRLVWGHIQ
jgi:hypothetical protein